ncbi:hypothetical protein ACR9GW_00210 [Enterobacter ludwigii]|uniref:hypothetical protein n=1 Tax=Enterobacter ludwigii TaxID=299767 RepID=UPI000B074A29|nr:hypothetical protein [Enterobacter ludwigii]
MRPVTLRIDGSFWDSQIYSNQLTLFDFDGGIHHLQWDAAIDSIAVNNQSIQTAFRVSFSDGDLFYNPKVRKILRDPDISPMIKNQLHNLSGLNIAVSLDAWRNFIISSDSPFNFLPTDTEFYYNNIFAGSDDGLYSIANSHSSKYAKKHFDGGVLKINASDRHTALAVAAGNDGLFEFAYKEEPTSVLGNEHLLNGTPCNSCEWAFQSVIGWSNEDAYLASFREEKKKDSRKMNRFFDRVIESSEIFTPTGNGDAGYIWGSREKLYRIRNGVVDVKHYSPKIRKNGKYKEQFSFDGEISVPSINAASVVATGTAPFGTVIETDDSLIILRSDGGHECFSGDIVHWRIFPRSENYNNQLHIIFEDHLLIVSFVHDYFVDQESKLSGFSRNIRVSDNLL